MIAKDKIDDMLKQHIIIDTCSEEIRHLCISLKDIEDNNNIELTNTYNMIQFLINKCIVSLELITKVQVSII